MRLAAPLCLTALSIALVFSSQLHAASIPSADDGAQIAESFCGAAEISRDEQLAVQKRIEEWLSANSAMVALGGNIKVAWHVISDGATGNIAQSQIDSMIVHLNRAFAGVPGGAVTGYTFSLASVSRTNSKKWFKMEAGTNEEQQAKRALATDVPHRLNIYSCRPPSGANWGTFPWSYTEGDHRHGVVLHDGYLPGGYLALNTGDIGVHEVGHYLGLYHTFQGGCAAPGDQVDDTPSENPGTGCCPCPEGRDTCPSPGLDPIHNYMAYTSDVCRTEFTSGQDDRMDSIVPIYRPQLLNAAFGSGEPVSDHHSSGRGSRFLSVAGVSFLGATPNPFNGQTEIRFSLSERRNVELQIYNTSGQLVTELVSGSMSAGEHSMSFDGRELSSGVYFVAMRVEGQLITRSIVLHR